MVNTRVDTNPANILWIEEVESDEGVNDHSPQSHDLSPNSDNLRVSPQSDGFSHNFNPVESNEGANDLNSCTLNSQSPYYAFVGNELPAKINGLIDMLRGGNDEIPDFWSNDDAERVPKELY